MKLHIAICDDESAEIEYLRSLVSSWAKEKHHTLELDTFPGAEAFLFAYDADQSFDILLLDIQMKQLDGISLAKKIRAVNREVQIIFVTGYMEYISDGYDVEALHYLLKPATPEKLSTVLTRAVEKLKRNEYALLLNHSGENLRIPLYEIRYLEVVKNYVTLHAGEKYVVKKTLKELEQELDNGFFRIGRSYIVNLHHVRRIAKARVTLSDGTVVPLSRGFYEPLNRAFIDFF